jgi:hypothetical protein
MRNSTYQLCLQAAGTSQVTCLLFASHAQMAKTLKQLQKSYFTGQYRPEKYNEDSQVWEEDREFVKKYMGDSGAEKVIAHTALVQLAAIAVALSKKRDDLAPIELEELMIAMDEVRWHFVQPPQEEQEN